mmetsp:Transcript_80810/g.160568  ORF Transcript_80810/g.160568 Transcript_80810/m.160568 type:complete len:232 (-) Transcript_80810:208-903(-)
MLSSNIMLDQRGVGEAHRLDLVAVSLAVGLHQLGELRRRPHTKVNLPMRHIVGRDDDIAVLGVGGSAALQHLRPPPSRRSQGSDSPLKLELPLTFEPGLLVLRHLLVHIVTLVVRLVVVVVVIVVIVIVIIVVVVVVSLIVRLAPTASPLGEFCDSTRVPVGHPLPPLLKRLACKLTVVLWCCRSEERIKLEGDDWRRLAEGRPAGGTCGVLGDPLVSDDASAAVRVSAAQ